MIEAAIKPELDLVFQRDNWEICYKTADHLENMPLHYFQELVEKLKKAIWTKISDDDKNAIFKNPEYISDILMKYITA